MLALAGQGFFGPPVGDLRVIFKKEMEAFWKECEAKTERMLRDHWKEVVAIAEGLLEHDDLTGKEVADIIKMVNGESNGHHPEEASEIVAEVVSEKTEDEPAEEEETESDEETVLETGAAD